ncbi:hypothetical protein LJ737_04230 [Hymenobacter sp. 15J16-1T3B]|uniref:hypothetical protein n=1 Tax=Hymenobacter sp. 15J16-1T3B TaxID=2886941 RepID=UPI001D128AEC|nr:hypothetical protein [Hymenobacter sp. 15J16-1T3B]MCC3156430.1 hypothetical protein [Hymenobacter sp. 15J16-1T3B]
MKTTYPLRSLFAILLPLTLLLSSCGDDDKKDDPKPATTHQVVVRYNGQNINGLGAAVSAGSVSPSGTATSYFSDNLATTTNISEQKPQPFTIPAGDDFSVTVSFTNVRGTQRAPAGATLYAAILVDGQVRKTVTIDNTTAPGNAYVTASAKILASEW